MLDPTLHEEAMLVTERLVYSGTWEEYFRCGCGTGAAEASALQPKAW